ncbi:hypothetical protein Scep_012207 [Stephania cephalantha]|uniref:Uncharacterized protein n=1 Tax=Stephania cephalantha TaxID=152367 RepID=A0AAP0JER9_9MAGN
MAVVKEKNGDSLLDILAVVEHDGRGDESLLETVVVATGRTSSSDSLSGDEIIVGGDGPIKCEEKQFDGSYSRLDSANGNSSDNERQGSLFFLLPSSLCPSQRFLPKLTDVSGGNNEDGGLRGMRGSSTDDCPDGSRQVVLQLTKVVNFPPGSDQTRPYSTPQGKAHSSQEKPKLA